MATYFVHGEIVCLVPKLQAIMGSVKYQGQLLSSLYYSAVIYYDGIIPTNRCRTTAHLVIIQIMSRVCIQTFQVVGENTFLNLTHGIILDPSELYFET